MPLVPKDPLLVIARTVVVIFQVLMVVAGAALTIALPAIFIFRGAIEAEILIEGVQLPASFPSEPIAGVLVLALATVVLFWFFLRHMRRIIDTVGEGDPFVPANAERLTAMAWITLAIQLVALPMTALVIAVQRAFQETNPSMDTDVDLSGIVLVLVLFILARVFRHGAAMREDLEGAV